MCGIAGLMGYRIGDTVLNNMVRTFDYRGPDDKGVWHEKSACIGLAHARLSIQDLSAAGHQPMISPSGRFVIAFNGEIYNHLELRNELGKISNISWNSHSDTETLLVGFEYWGIKNTLKKSVGMFAISVWDAEKKQLFLARDRFGEKPLYYGWQNNTLMFASELKALKVHPDFEGVLNRKALNHYFRLNYIPTPFSIYENIFKLEPGTFAIFSNKGAFVGKETFWSAEEITSKTADLSGLFESDFIDKLESLIKSSISDQMLSDVPLGAFLSGGIDSSTVVAIMQNLSERPVKTFTIGFSDENFNEAGDAEAVANYLGTDHKELILSVNDALSVIELLPSIYDEPFSDASQIPTFLVSKLAKEDVTVCLSGDGGDELFCGYNRYIYTEKVWSKLKKIPFPLRKIFCGLLMSISPSFWDKLGQLTGLSNKLPNLGNKIQKGAIALKSRSIDDLYTRVVSNWGIEEKLVKCAEFKRPPFLSRSEELSHLNDLEKMMLWDKQSYLMDGVLVKTDRATMACSLEGRVPLLDYRIAEFAARLPIDLKYREGKGKWVLREVLYRYVPKELIERPKKGFSLPIADWLRGPLKSWAEKLLDAKRIDKEGYLESSLVEKKWQEHLTGKRDWSAQLWSVLMFQLWLEKNS